MDFNFDKMIEGLSFSELRQLRDKCELKLNKRADEHIEVIRKAIYEASSEGFNIYFTSPYNDDCFPLMALTTIV